MTALLFLFFIFAIIYFLLKNKKHKNKFSLTTDQYWTKQINKIQKMNQNELHQFFINEGLGFLKPEQQNVHNAVNYAHRLRTLQQQRDAQVTKVKLLNCNDQRDCKESYKLKNKIFKIDNAPDLPCKKCTAEICRCTFVPVEYADD